MVAWSFFFFVAPSLAVFYQASAFNQDVSKWNTGAVTTMSQSKCSLSLRLPLLSNLNIRQHEFHRITILTRFVLSVFVCFKRYSFLLFVVWVGLSSFFVAPSLMQCFIEHLRSIRTCHKDFLTAKPPPPNDLRLMITQPLFIHSLHFLPLWIHGTII